MTIEEEEALKAEIVEKVDDAIDHLNSIKAGIQREPGGGQPDHRDNLIQSLSEYGGEAILASANATIGIRKLQKEWA